MSPHPLLAAAAAAALIGLTDDTFAQANPSYRMHCQGVGPATREPVAGREGVVIEQTHQSCVQEGGVMNGAIYTGTTVWEITGPTGKIVAGLGVSRLPGALAVSELAEGSLTLQLEGGRVAGFTGSCKGVTKHASGAASELAGKPFACTMKGTGYRRFSMEISLH